MGRNLSDSRVPSNSFYAGPSELLQPDFSSKLSFLAFFISTLVTNNLSLVVNASRRYQGIRTSLSWRRRRAH